MSFYKLLNVIGPNISPNLNSPNRMALNADKKLAVALYFLKVRESLKMTTGTFRIQINTTSAVVIEVCEAIIDYLGPLHLFLPKTEDEMRQKRA